MNMSKLLLKPDLKKKPLKQAIVCYFSFFLFIFLLSPAAFSTKVLSLRVDEPIGPAMADYLTRGIKKGQDSSLILIELNSAGGSLKSIRKVVQAQFQSRVPVLSYISTQASGDSIFLVYAATLAAMTPQSSLANPPFLTSWAQGSAHRQGLHEYLKTKTGFYFQLFPGHAQGVTSTAKTKNAAKKMSFSAKQALDQNLIQEIAENKTALLRQLQGKIVIQNGQHITLNTQGMLLESYTQDSYNRALFFIASPTMAYLLFLMGAYGLLWTAIHPRQVFTRSIAVFLLFMALYVFQLLPTNYLGLVGIVLGLLLVIFETLLTPGILGIIGTLVFIIGSLFLFQNDGNSWHLALPQILAMAALNVFILFSIFIRARKKRLKTGMSGLLGFEGRTLESINLQGQAVIKGQIWRVQAREFIAADHPIRVIATKGLRLEVEEKK